MSKISGTPYYIAPEVLNETYDEKCDVWSCGVILYILLCGYPPFNGDDDVQIMKAVKKGKYDFPDEEWASISTDAKDLIMSMLTYNAAERISAEECLNDKWFAKNKSKEKNTNIDLLNSAIKNMKTFKADRKLEQATASFIVNQLVSKKERNELMAQFQAWDINGDGQLSREEIYEGYKNLCGEVKAEEEVDQIMKSIDLNGDGFIDYNEFLVGTMNRSKMLSAENLESTFNTFDKVNLLSFNYL